MKIKDQLELEYYRLSCDDKYKQPDDRQDKPDQDDKNNGSQVMDEITY